MYRNRVPWPRLYSGRLDLEDRTFREMAKIDPRVAPLRELRGALSELRLNDLAVGKDGRNRTLLSAFRARTARNQPSNSKFVFGPSTWIRGLIKPPRGLQRRLCRLVPAGVRHCRRAVGRRQTCRPHTGRVIRISNSPSRPVPCRRTPLSTTHPLERDQFKACALGVQYGLEAAGLAQRIAQPLARGRHLLEAHHQAYRKFWAWSDSAIDHAMLLGFLDTVFGWTIHVDSRRQPTLAAQLPHAGQRLGDAAPGLLPGDRAGRAGGRPGARRRADLRTRRERSTSRWP